jgi:GSH-dependent disulfide-bond oxidoreductase
MIDLYTASTSNGRRAAIALEECGLAYRVHKLDLHSGDAKKPEFLKINPAGGIPVIVDLEEPNGKPISIAQSGAILLYCAEKSGKLLPKDPAKRIEAFQWFMQAVTDIVPSSSVLFYLSLAPEQSMANAKFFEQRLLNYCAIADKQLAGREYLAGELSIADLALYPVIASRKALVDAASGLANLKNWEQRLSSRPSIVRAMVATADVRLYAQD